MTRTGVIIHLHRDEELTETDAEFINQNFTKYAELKDSPRVMFISSQELLSNFGQQIEDMKALFRHCTTGSTFEDSVVRPMEGEQVDGVFNISIDIQLDNASVKLTIYDDYATEIEIRICLA